jgi:hypothetical protein
VCSNRESLDCCTLSPCCEDYGLQNPFHEFYLGFREAGFWVLTIEIGEHLDLVKSNSMAVVRIGNLLPPARLIQCYSKVICERSLQHPESDFFVFERLGRVGEVHRRNTKGPFNL